MDINTQLEALIHRLERIEEKLDDHLQRVSSAERDIEWIRGHLKIATGIALSALSGLIAWVASKISLS